MKNRIKQLRDKELKMSQTDFGKKINLNQSTIGNYENGRREIPDRVIADICREFNVNEDWLRTGEGSIFREMTEVEKMKKQIDQAMEGRNEFLKNSLYALTELDDEEWALLEKMFFKIYDYNRNEEFKKRINEKNVTKSVTTPLQDKK